MYDSYFRWLEVCVRNLRFRSSGGRKFNWFTNDWLYTEPQTQTGIDCFILVLTSYKYHGYIFGIDGGLLINKLIDSLKFNPATDSVDAVDKQRLVLIDTVKIKEETMEELDGKWTT